MRKVLIISGHFVPSNLTGVHRARLFAVNLPKYGWDPTILTVCENFYEEKHDFDLELLLPEDLEIVKVKAFKVSKRFRVIGDIGLRGFFQLYRKACEIISTHKIDLVLIEVPSFYLSLLGRLLHKKTNIIYGIDYIDPWVHRFRGSERFFSRHWIATKLAKFLEPIAVNKASFISGITEGYYADVFKRNPHLKSSCISDYMPYGGDLKDHEALKFLKKEPYLFKKKSEVKQLVYAGALLPASELLLHQIFENISNNEQIYENVKIHFIGTGNDIVENAAIKYDILNRVIFHHSERLPYLDVLLHLHEADGILIIGSTEPHYSPSKIYQAILSQKPIMALLHKNSEAIKLLKDYGAHAVAFDENNIDKTGNSFSDNISHFKNGLSNTIKYQLPEQYTASASAGRLARLMNRVME
jgi:hypothetical protein